MSASHDKSQKFLFVVPSERETQSATPGLTTARANERPQMSPRVLRTREARPAGVEAYQAPRFQPRRVVSRPEVISPLSGPKTQSSSAAVDSLRQNLSALNDLHARLRFMLEELEDLVKE